MHSESNQAQEANKERPCVDFYVDKFTHTRKGSAKAIIELSATLYEAEVSLSSHEFSSFCAQVSIEQGKSYHKKLRSIGRDEIRLMSIVHNLPNSWTTIYKVSCLRENEFGSLVDKQIITPWVTAKRIEEHLSCSPDCVTRKSSKRGTTNKITIVWRSLSPDNKLEILNFLYDLKSRLGLIVSGEGSLNDEAYFHGEKETNNA